MNYLMCLVGTKVKGKKGQGMSEYALILAGVAALAIAVVAVFGTGTGGTLRTAVMSIFTEIETTITNLI